MNRVSLVLTWLVVGVSIACSDGDATVTPASPTVASSPGARPGSSPSPGAVERLTGIAEVDAVVEALLSGDPARVRSMVGYVRVPCAVEPEGIGAPPACRPGETEGTPVEVFQGAQCEGFYLRPDELDQTVGAITAQPLELYAVFEADGRWPEGEYVALFGTDFLDRPERDAVAATIADGRMVGFHFGCAMTPESYLDFYRVTEFVLPPP
jgi:hypothetical protein